MSNPTALDAAVRRFPRLVRVAAMYGVTSPPAIAAVLTDRPAIIAEYHLICAKEGR
jgi:hypothetical protein